MLMHKFGEGVRLEVMVFDESLHNLSALLEEWQGCQTVWMNLSSILRMSSTLQVTSYYLQALVGFIPYHRDQATSYDNRSTVYMAC